LIIKHIYISFIEIFDEKKQNKMKQKKTKKKRTYMMAKIQT